MTVDSLTLRQALRVHPPMRVAFTGAGGKTTAIFQLARQLPPPVIITTTTHLGVWQAALADRHVMVADEEDAVKALANPSGVLLLTGAQVKSQRLDAPSPLVLHAVMEICERSRCSLLIEADGARERPLKAPEDHEPVIPEWVDCVVVTAGLSGVSRLCADVSGAVHRPQRFAELGGLSPGDEITPQAVTRVLSHPLGGLKGIPPAARRVVLLNQADHELLARTGREIADQLISFYDAVCVVSLQQGRVDSVVESVAGILLAAGASTRFGSPKALLPWRGRPLIRHVAEQALAGGVSPLVVVVGEVEEAICHALADLPVICVFNPDWNSGQSTSLKVGLRAAENQVAPRGLGAAVFLLADQPFLRADLVAGLIAQYRRSLAPVIAPRVAGRRANPVLFSRDTFPALATLQGDTGGRAVFDRFPPAWLDWEDQRLLLDIDTPEDYERILALAEEPDNG